MRELSPTQKGKSMSWIKTVPYSKLAKIIVKDRAEKAAYKKEPWEPQGAKVDESKPVKKYPAGTLKSEDYPPVK